MTLVDTHPPQERALVIHVSLKSKKHGGSTARAPQACLEEAVGLAHAIDLEVPLSLDVIVDKARPATLLGPGKIDEIRSIIETHGCGLLVVDATVSPIQQRNLERALNVKVLDRTGLILEIFGRRAQTREGVLQVELAHLEYQKSRLVRSWTHLERQRGGFGFLGGPGETQIETDRRLIGERIARLKKDLEQVVRTRGLHRKTRREVPYPIVALVGYTNAGKSTLFNRLTSENVLAEDMVFATLDPVLREVVLPQGRRILLADTVGFISNLPTHLIAAFRATLEEVLVADVIVHVRDSSHPDCAAQAEDVAHVLGTLGLDEARQEGILEVWNKSDLLPQDEQNRLHERARLQQNMFPLSALTGEGEAQLKSGIEEALSQTDEEKIIFIPYGDGKKMAWLHAHGAIVGERDDGEKGGVWVQIRLPHPLMETVRNWK